TLYTLQLETLLYIFIAGTGMYFLLRQFGITQYVTLMCSAAYMLCGFNIDCTQYLNWISSAAFIPFCLLFYYKTLYKVSIFNAFFCGLFLYLMFVCAYPAHFILLAYLLLAVF